MENLPFILSHQSPPRGRQVSCSLTGNSSVDMNCRLMKPHETTHTYTQTHTRRLRFKKEKHFSYCSKVWVTFSFHLPSWTQSKFISVLCIHMLSDVYEMLELVCILNASSLRNYII